MKQNKVSETISILSRRRTIKRSCNHSNRRAVAMVELAVCMPVIVLVVFASLEGANMLFVRQATVQEPMRRQNSLAEEMVLVCKRNVWQPRC